jgi:hypothetical protein
MGEENNTNVVQPARRGKISSQQRITDTSGTDDKLLVIAIVFLAWNASFFQTAYFPRC